MKALRNLLIFFALLLIFIAPMLWIVGSLVGHTLITKQEYLCLAAMFVIGLLLYLGNGGGDPDKGSNDRVEAA